MRISTSGIPSRQLADAEARMRFAAHRATAEMIDFDHHDSADGEVRATVDLNGTPLTLGKHELLYVLADALGESVPTAESFDIRLADNSSSIRRTNPRPVTRSNQFAYVPGDSEAAAKAVLVT